MIVRTNNSRLNDLRMLYNRALSIIPTIENRTAAIAKL